MSEIFTGIQQLDSAFGRLNGTMTALVGERGQGRTSGLLCVALRMASMGVRTRFLGSSDDDRSALNRLAARAADSLSTIDRGLADVASRNFSLVHMDTMPAQGLETFLISEIVRPDIEAVVIDDFDCYNDLCVGGGTLHAANAIKRSFVERFGIPIIMSLRRARTTPIRQMVERSLCLDNIMTSSCQRVPSGTAITLCPVKARGSQIGVSSPFAETIVLEDDGRMTVPASEMAAPAAVTFDIPSDADEKSEAKPSERTIGMPEYPMASDTELEDLIGYEVDPMA